ncbi:MAG: NAD(+) kinase [Francisellaceae bacterium]
MAIAFRHIAIIGTHRNPCVKETVVHLHQYLQNHAALYIELETADSLDFNPKNIYTLDEIAKNCDLAIIVGGDGNFLNASRILSCSDSIPVVGINRGSLGFLTDIMPDEIETRLMPILQGQYIKERRFMFKTYAYRGAQLLGEASAFNEIVLASGSHSRLFEMRISIDGSYAFDQRADGIIVSTPTGSTAHALSAGGPIMHPSLNATVIVPMFSHSLNSRPLIINGDSSVEILIGHYNEPSPILSFDGHSELSLKAEDRILINKDRHHVSILHPLDYDYYHNLRAKLHWGKMLFP